MTLKYQERRARHGIYVDNMFWRTTVNVSNHSFFKYLSTWIPLLVTNKQLPVGLEVSARHPTKTMTVETALPKLASNLEASIKEQCPVKVWTELSVAALQFQK